MQQEVTLNPPIKTEKRRGGRFPVIVPVQAKWQETSGKIVSETAQAREVNAQGGLLDMKAFPSVGSQLELTNLLSGETYRARVVAIRRKDGQFAGVAVELLIPSETFWGVNFQLKKTSSELLNLERAIRSGGIDQRILTDFRDAVDYVRKTAWAVQEWQERQLRHHDTHTLIPLLVSERVRRGAQLSNAIAADLTNHEVSRDTPGVDQLFDAITRVRQLLAELLNDGATA
jgi:hypothetical protein